MTGKGGGDFEAGAKCEAGMVSKSQMLEPHNIPCQWLDFLEGSEEPLKCLTLSCGQLGVYQQC